MTRQLTLTELYDRLAARKSVDELEVAALLCGSPQERREAAHGLFLSHQRESLKALGLRAENELYSNQETVTLMQHLAIIADDPLPSLNMLKAMGIRAAELGASADAMRILQASADLSWVHAQRSGPYFQMLLNFMHDPEIDAALARIAQGYGSPQFVAEARARRRIVLFASCIIDENSPSMVTEEIANQLSAAGHEVIIVSSEFGDSKKEKAYQRMLDSGFQIELTPSTGHMEKIAHLVATFERLQADVVLYLITPMDYVAKVISEIGVAPAQCMCNMAYEHYCGKFDYVLQSTSLEQEHITAWPGKSKFIGSFAVLEKRMADAVKFDRTMWSLTKDHILLVTHGRVSKCSSDYITAVRRILEANENAVLILAGAVGEPDLERLKEGFGESTSMRRLMLIGPLLGQVPELLKACDVYLDPFPWPGGQSTLEAMWTGIPVVAMKPLKGAEHDADSRGPIGSATDAFLPEGYERADANDIDGYVRIASKYVRDAATRQRDGAQLRAHVAKEYSTNAFMQKLDHYLELAIRSKELLAAKH